MRNVNLALRKAYKLALTGITFESTPVVSYYAEIPNHLDPDYYIVFGGINNSDISTKKTSDTTTQVTVTIYTKKDIYNNGNAAEDIADQVLDRIYQTTDFKLDVIGFQLLRTKLVSDNTQEISMNAQLKYIDRTLVFSHNIYHK